MGWKTTSFDPHVSNLAQTLLYALSLDRNVVLEDINIYSR